MSVAARKIESGGFMEERVARLEVKVDHVQTDVTELKARVIRLEDKVERFRESLEAKIGALDQKIDAVKESLEEKIDALRDSISALRVSRWVDRVWWLVIAGGLLGVMARGFKWI